MNFIKISIAILALSSLVVLAFASVAGFPSAAPGQVEHLHGKWRLSHYEVFGENYPPEENERKDYIHFYADKSFSSASSGISESGTYQFDGTVIRMRNESEQGELKLLVQGLSADQLSVVIDDASDPDAKYLTIHFKR